MTVATIAIIPRCGICEPDTDPGPLMDGLTEANCAHCGAIVIRHKRWKPDGAGIVIGSDVFICTPPGEAPALSGTTRGRGLVG